MDTVRNGLSSDDTAAVNSSSPDWAEASSRRRGSRRRISAAVTSADSSRGSPSANERVLRARTVPLLKSPPNVQRRAAGSRCKNAPVTQSEKTKPKAKKTSKQVVGPKLSKGRKDKGRSGCKSSCTTPVTCKSETESAASLCGQDVDDVRGINENGKSKCRTSLPQTEVKKEESDTEEENEKCPEEQGSTQDVVQSGDGVDDNAESNRKRNRRDNKAPRQPKRRKKPPVQYVRCEMEGCGTVLAHPRYLQHHIKYQHLLKKKYVCDHPSCGRLFRLQKQLLRHAKHHTDQRDYICEYCARAFKSSYNLAVHRMIHTGEKPIQCEICGFTCRQKASLNWHMKKHDVEASFQFSCSICGKKFEKKDSVVAHKAKIHPKVLIAEAMAANGGLVISASVPVTSQPELLPVSQVSAEQQVQVDISQGQFHQLEVDLAAASATQLYTDPPQLIQLSPVSPSDTQSTLLTLTSVTSLTPPPTAHWGSGTHDDTQIATEGESWDRVVAGEASRHAEGIVWEGAE
ncbi:unnamed protein product [Ophioblennius macclurei]